jgi:hypothetical protein
MNRTEFLEFCDNYTGELLVFGCIALDLNMGIFYY